MVMPGGAALRPYLHHTKKKSRSQALSRIFGNFCSLLLFFAYLGLMMVAAVAVAAVAVPAMAVAAVGMLVMVVVMVMGL